MWELQRKCPCARPSCPTPCAAADDPPVHPPVHQKTPGESYDSPTESPLPTLTSLPPFSMWSSLLPMFFSATDNQCWSWHFSFIPLISTLVQHLLWVTATFLWDCLSSRLPTPHLSSSPLVPPSPSSPRAHPSPEPFPLEPSCWSSGPRMLTACSLLPSPLVLPFLRLHWGSFTEPLYWGRTLSPATVFTISGSSSRQKHSVFC